MPRTRRAKPQGAGPPGGPGTRPQAPAGEAASTPPGPGPTTTQVPDVPPDNPRTPDQAATLICKILDQAHAPEARLAFDALLASPNSEPTPIRQALAQIFAAVNSLRQEVRALRRGQGPTPAHANSGTGPGPRTWAGVAAGAQPTVPPRREVEVMLDKVPDSVDLGALRDRINQQFGAAGVLATRRLPSKNVVLVCISKATATRIQANLGAVRRAMGTDTISIRPQCFRVLAHLMPTDSIDLSSPEGRATACQKFQDRNRHTPGIQTIAWLNPHMRPNQRHGSLVVAYSSAEQADRAIRSDLAWDHSVLRVELYTPAGTVTQCYNCCRFGHIAQHCPAPTRCAICFGDHAARECPHKTTPRSAATKCGNFGGPHPAWSGECRVRARHAQRAWEARTSKPQYYGGGPPPSTASYYPPLPIATSAAAVPALSHTFKFTAGRALSTERGKRIRITDDDGFEVVGPRRREEPPSASPPPARPRGRPPAPAVRSGDIRQLLANRGSTPTPTAEPTSGPPNNPGPSMDPAQADPPQAPTIRPRALNLRRPDADIRPSNLRPRPLPLHAGARGGSRSRQTP